MRAQHTPEDQRIFVFGSNLLGIHGAGAARYAHEQLGRRMGTGVGLIGRTYALPTCHAPGVPMDLGTVGVYVDFFIIAAKAHPELEFYVSAVGCGIAGFTEAEIAPLFADAPSNCDLPDGWRT